MGRFVGNTPNHMSVGGAGGGNGTIVQTSAFDRVTGLTTYSINNNVGIVTLGDNKYTEIQYNNVGLITGYNEIIGNTEKGWVLTYDSVGIVSTIVDRGSLHPVGAGASAQGPADQGGGGGGGGGGGAPSGLYTFTNATFTTGGTEGYQGPSLAAAKTGLSVSGGGSDDWKEDTSYFNVTAGIQEWTVPETATYRIEAYGADARTSDGGYGAIVSGNHSLTEGEVIKILVGQAPKTYSSSNDHCGGGGTFVVRTPYNTTASVLCVAGGGGGAHDLSDFRTDSNANTGTSGKPGTDNWSGGSNGQGSTSGAQGGGGAGFLTNGQDDNNGGIAKAFVNGGEGGYVTSSIQGGFGGGAGHGNTHGGGGGGYSGGGGSSDSPYAGGGGGSYIDGNATNTSITVNSSAVGANGGKVIITKAGTIPSSTPVYTADGQSYYITNNTTTWNGVKVWYAQSSSTGFSNSTPTTDDWGPYVVDGNYANTKWYIGMNFGGTSLPSRWNNVNAVYSSQDISSGTSFTFGTSNTGGPHRTRFYSVRGSSTQVSGTSAGIVTCNYNDVEADANQWTNGAGAGFASFYADSNKSDQKYPDIITAIRNASPQYNPEGHSNGDDTSGMMLWRPPAPTKEVMIAYANNHSNSPCNITCWDNNTGSVKWQARYGNYTSVDTGGGTLNPNGGRVIVAEHQDGYVYFNSDHAGTVSGAWYYLYR